MILWIPCLKWRVNICEKIWEALFADFKFLFLFIFCELYDKLLQKFDACDFIFSCKEKKKESTIVWHLKCTVQSLINVDYSIKIHLNETFFLLLMQSHSLCSVEQVLTSTRQNSLYLKCKFWQVLGFFLQLNANFCQVSSKIKTSTITNEQIWQGMIKETDKDKNKGKKEFC